jgi:hypothetical protein
LASQQCSQPIGRAIVPTYRTVISSANVIAATAWIPAAVMTHAQTDAMTRRAIAMNGAINRSSANWPRVLVRSNDVAR